MSIPEDYEMHTSEDFEMCTPEDTYPKCSCRLPATLRVSHTARNPSRLFYNCPKSFAKQCGFFHWCDEPTLTGDRHTDELNLSQHECNLLQERLDEIQERHDNDRNVWEREKSELMLKLSTVQAELDDLKKRIKIVNESDHMPPHYKFSNAVDEEDDVKVIHSI